MSGGRGFTRRRGCTCENVKIGRIDFSLAVDEGRNVTRMGGGGVLPSGRIPRLTPNVWVILSTLWVPARRPCIVRCPHPVLLGALDFSADGQRRPRLASGVLVRYVEGQK